MPTCEEFNKFIEESGLKRKFVAEKINLPYWIIANWLRGSGVLYAKQHMRLEEFMSKYRANNNFMNVEREIEDEN